jgi:predicted Zn-dependent protease
MKIECKFHKYIFILLLSAALFSLHLFPGAFRAFPLSVEEERILGQNFLVSIFNHFDVVDDDFANDYINDLGHYLIRPLATKHFPYRFYIINDHTLNAFAGPGGHIFIFSGLINLMDKPDELAAVICHEIGHVAARHLADRMEQNQKINLATMAGMLAGVLIGGKAGAALTTGTVAAGIQAQLHYSRSDERQADMLGFKYLAYTGFEPSGIITVLKKMHEGQWVSTKNIPPYLLTHPGGPERISNIQVMLSGYTTKSEGGRTDEFRKLFPFLKTVLKAKYLESHEAERLFHRELDKDPDSTLAHFGLGIVWNERSEYLKSIDYFLKALKGQPESLLILRNLGEAYQMKGEDEDAIVVLERALKIDNQNKPTLFLMAISYQNLGEYPKATHLLEKLASMKPVKNEVFYNLGVSYGKQDRLSRAHYNFGIYFKRLRRMQEATFHFQKAKALSRGDPSLKRKIRKETKGLR